MKFTCPLLLLAAASALELQSELPRNWTYTNKYESARNNNRLRWRTQGFLAGDIVDRRGWATGTPPTFTTANANWFGGCRLQAGEMYEEYMNNVLANSVATRRPQHKNRRVSGLVAYRCEDNGADADAGSQDCYVTATARGYNWDSTAFPNAVGGDAVGGTMIISIYKPIRFVDATYDPNPEEYDMTKYCTIPSHVNAGADVPAGAITPLMINQIASTGLTLTTGTYRNSNYLSEEFKDPTAVDVLSATYEDNALENLRYDQAGAVLQYGGYAGLSYDATNALPFTLNNKNWLDLHSQPVQQIPNAACCKFEQWPKRTYIRYHKKITARREALEANVYINTKTATILAAPAAV